MLTISRKAELQLELVPRGLQQNDILYKYIIIHKNDNLQESRTVAGARAERAAPRRSSSAGRSTRSHHHSWVVYEYHFLVVKPLSIITLEFSPRGTLPPIGFQSSSSHSQVPHFLLEQVVVNYTLVEEDILAGKNQGQGKLYPNVKVDPMIWWYSIKSNFLTSCHSLN